MNKRQKKIFLDGIFFSQVVMGVLFGVIQIIKMQTSVEGLTVPVFLFNIMFSVIVWVFAYNSNKANPSKITIQPLIIYTMAITVYSAILGVYLYKTNTYWLPKDTLTAMLVAIGAGIVVLVCRKRSMEPLPRAYMGVVFKGVPQMFFALNMLETGSSTGLSAFFVFGFHYMWITRMYQIQEGAKDHGWSKERIGLAISESGNELTWIFVTYAWLTTT